MGFPLCHHEGLIDKLACPHGWRNHTLGPDQQIDFTRFELGGDLGLPSMHERHAHPGPRDNR